ncbi:unnamed protein product [Brassica rapa]|uniref:Uncharacterized protein n=2 Tax=Brassica TaxID=3705 RepID=A0A3P5ZLJ5_BRACM|nr:unnamed protein product [Brassica napus]CAG7889952.1 unnamed protein product [Brassica rapa]VDC77235.1 unnamed protein product [Brassica rapa]
MCSKATGLSIALVKLSSSKSSIVRKRKDLDVYEPAVVNK